jgi:uncharacterized membrane protein YraQ (UPF0718 family)
MGYLIGSLLTVAVGPLLFHFARKRQASFAALDGFVMITVAALVLAHILPHAVESAGPVALLFGIAGFSGPSLAEHALHRAARGAHWVAVFVALIGVVGHSVLDGVALQEEAFHSHATALAVVLHGIPVGVTIWWLLRPTMGAAFALFMLGLQCAATIFGYVVAPSMVDTMSTFWVGALQAVVGGALLHVVLHRTPPMDAPVTNTLGRRADGIGALVGIVFSIFVFKSHDEVGIGQTFVELCLESAPALVLAFTLAGVVQVLLPSAPLAFMRTGRAPSEAIRGMIFGLPLPICSCAVVPIYESLISRAVPTTAAMAFLVATPELGIDAILLSVPLLGADLTALRIAAAAFVAFTIGWFVGRRASTQPARTLVSAEVPIVTGWRSKLRLGLRYGLVDLVDHVGPWLVFGIAIAALVEPLLRNPWLQNLPWGVDVILFTLLGMPSYVCASGATPLAAVLIANGVSPGAAIAFLLSGPGTNVTTFGVLSRIHGRKVAFLFGFTMLVVGAAIGFGINFLFEKGKVDVPSFDHERASLLQITSLAALCVLFAWSILRQGARGFVGQVLTPYAESEGHDHGHDHGHCH